jgi:hypothetical protein
VHGPSVGSVPRPLDPSASARAVGTKTLGIVGGNRVSEEEPATDKNDIGLRHRPGIDETSDEVVAVLDDVAEQLGPPSSETVGIGRVKGHLDTLAHTRRVRERPPHNAGSWAAFWPANMRPTNTGLCQRALAPTGRGARRRPRSGE